MHIRKSLIATLAVAALALPVTSAGFVALSTTAAIAKGGNGGGKGGGSSTRGNSGKSKSGNRGSNRGYGGNKGGGNGGGNGKAATMPPKSQAPQAQVAAAVETTEGVEDETMVDMPPNKLGSMNGALHANINAVLAHMKNGNTNGPVGALAGLAIADHKAEEAEDVLALAEDFETVGTLLAEGGFSSVEEYQDAVEAGEAESISELDTLIEALEASGVEAPTQEEIAAAEGALEDQIAAVEGIFEAWNKSGEATEEEKAALLEALRARLEAEAGAIDAAMDATMDEGSDEASAEGAEEEEVEISDTGDEVLDPEVEAILSNLKF